MPPLRSHLGRERPPSCLEEAARSPREPIVEAPLNLRAQRRRQRLRAFPLVPLGRLFDGEEHVGRVGWPAGLVPDQPEARTLRVVEALARQGAAAAADVAYDEGGLEKREGHLRETAGRRRRCARQPTPASRAGRLCAWHGRRPRPCLSGAHARACAPACGTCTAHAGLRAPVCTRALATEGGRETASRA